MHSADHRTKLWKKARRNPFVFPLDDIQVYYGELGPKISIDFHSDFHNKCLFPLQSQPL